MKIFGWQLNKKAATRIEPPFGMRYTPHGFVFSDGKTEVLLKDGFGMNSTVYSIISIMSKKFASVPWILYKTKTGKTQAAKRYKTLTDGYAASVLAAERLKAVTFDEVTGEHEILTLFDKPNTHQTGEELRESILQFRKATGAAPIFMNTGLSRSKPVALEVYPSQYIVLEPDETLQSFRKVAYTITGAQVEIPKEQFIYWKYPNPFYSLTGEHLYGLAPLKAGARVLGSDNENMDAQAFTFKHKGSTGMFTPKTIEDANAAAKQVDQIRQAIDDRANGRDYGKARSYSNVPMDLHTYGMTAAEMDSLRIHIQNKEDLCNIFNFPPLLLISATGTDNRYDAAIKYLLTNSLYNDLTGYRALWNEIIIPAFGYAEGEYFLDFDLSAIPEMQEDMEKLVASLDKMWWLTGNEKRIVTKYDELAVPEMNEILVPSGYQPLSAAFDASTNIDPNIMQ